MTAYANVDRPVRAAHRNVVPFVLGETAESEAWEAAGRSKAAARHLTSHRTTPLKQLHIPSDCG